MVRPTFGDDTRLERDPKRGKPKQQMLGAFMPGQLGLLSQQLSTGFGGRPQQFRGMLQDIYSPVPAPQPFVYGQRPRPNQGGNGGNGGNNGNGQPVLNPDGTVTFNGHTYQQNYPYMTVVR